MSEPSQPEHASQTRDKILSHAARLFSSQGYENTSLSQIARDAKVSKALIFWHFESKEKLFQAALGRTLEPYFINTETLAGLDEPGQIEQLIDLFHEFVRANMYSVRFFFSLVLQGENQPNDVMVRINELYGIFRSLLVGIIETGRQSGRFHPDVNPHLDAALILASLDGILIERFLRGDAPEEPGELVAYLKQATIQRLRG